MKTIIRAPGTRSSSFPRGGESRYPICVVVQRAVTAALSDASCGVADLSDDPDLGMEDELRTGGSWCPGVPLDHVQ